MHEPISEITTNSDIYTTFAMVIDLIIIIITIETHLETELHVSISDEPWVNYRPLVGLYQSGEGGNAFQKVPLCFPLVYIYMRFPHQWN